MQNKLKKVERDSAEYKYDLVHIWSEKRANIRKWRKKLPKNASGESSSMDSDNMEPHRMTLHSNMNRS